MGVIDIIRIAAGVGLAIVAAVFCVEAWQQAKGRAVLCVLVPFYLFYFAFIKSTRSLPFRIALVACTLLVLVPSPRPDREPPPAAAEPAQ